MNTVHERNQGAPLPGKFDYDRHRGAPYQDQEVIIWLEVFLHKPIPEMVFNQSCKKNENITKVKIRKRHLKGKLQTVASNCTEKKKITNCKSIFNLVDHKFGLLCRSSFRRRGEAGKHNCSRFKSAKERHGVKNRNPLSKEGTSEDRRSF